MQTATTTRSGALEGRRTRHGVVFRGVPYASVRGGSGRFRAAGPVVPWSGTRRAWSRGPSAPQRAALPPWLRALGAVPAAGWDEDCLCLDVYTPGCEQRGLPVLVFVHGGAFTHGAGSFWVYAGDRLAARGAVVVTINYRLGAFGNVDLRWLDGATTEANVGLRDQIAALRWVREEIAAFGGDPGNVTLFGQSAGAMSIGALLAAPGARGLFHRAILQSGAARNVHDPVTAHGVAARLLAELGIDPDSRDAVARLRDLPVAALLRAQHAVVMGHRLPLGVLPWQPVVDGDLLPVDPLAAVRNGDAAAVPLLIGTNRDEWRMFTAMDERRRNLDAKRLRAYLGRSLERDGLAGVTDVDEVLALYGADETTGGTRSPADVWVAFQGDRVFRRPAVDLADAHAGRGAPTWLYRFDRAPVLGRARLGACHAIELPFVFGTVRVPALRAAFAWPPDAIALSDRMLGAWVAFARDGVPADDEGGDWPRYVPAGGRARVLGGAETEADAASESLRRYWTRLTPAAAAPSRAAPA